MLYRSACCRSMLRLHVLFTFDWFLAFGPFHCSSGWLPVLLIVFAPGIFSDFGDSSGFSSGTRAKDTYALVLVGECQRCPYIHGVHTYI